MKPGLKAAAKLHRRIVAYDNALEARRKAGVLNPEAGYHVPGSRNRHKTAPKGRRA